MESVYVLEPGSYLRREAGTLLVVKDGSVVSQIPAAGLKKLILVGRVSLTGGLLDFLIQNRVETVFMTPTGRFRARLGLDEHKHVALRKAQYLRLSDPAFALSTARLIVSGKIENMARFLLLRARQYREDALRLSVVKLRGLKGHIPEAADLDVLRGMEGAAARVYYEAFRLLVKNPGFAFHGRTRRPPLDPPNALLSFVYTLLTNEVLSAVKSAGLDPYLGSLHDVDYGRPSLACDLVEEYRCFLGDRLILGLINRKALSPDDFVFRAPHPAEFIDEKEMKEKRPVEMKPAVSRTFIAAYEEAMNRSVFYPRLGKKLTYRWLILQQARAFGAYLEEPQKLYRPFLWEG
ncbi:MAG: CRISPR-associated endonuclease Cas1 [Deltaproteobacteria bacterium]|nr:CRISPR-associated endonuclease Cas1 [Deltaproteobacteria bacterium]